MFIVFLVLNNVPVNDISIIRIRIVSSTLHKIKIHSDIPSNCIVSKTALRRMSGINRGILKDIIYNF